MIIPTPWAGYTANSPVLNESIIVFDMNFLLEREEKGILIYTTTGLYSQI